MSINIFIFDSSSSICGIFLDITKAFDSVSHSLLLHKLHLINLPPHILLWLHSYLSSRTQSVKISHYISSSLPVTSGVPQGSILGPLLFIIFFKDISRYIFPPPFFCFSPSSLLDEILLLHPFNSPQDCLSINNQLATITSWLSSHSLQINTQNSKYIDFSYKKPSHFDSFPPITLGLHPQKSILFQVLRNHLSL